MPVYVDTSAWIALHEPKDRNHPAATRRLGELFGAAEVLVTGWHTLVELADGLAHHYSQRHAAQETRRILASPHVRVEDSEIHLAAALEIFHRNTDWEVDLSDCLSFALMKARSIPRAFTYDSDFEKAGFQRLD